MEIKIAIAYHKTSLLLQNDCFMPIHVGKALHPEVNLNIQGDDDGDNISLENGYYCELTAIYWLWKNTDADIKGLMHYRRILDPKTKLILPIRKIKAKLTRGNFYPLQNYSEKIFEKTAEKLCRVLPELMGSYDIVASLPSILTPNVKTFFYIIGREYIDILVKAAEMVAPEYLIPLKTVLEGTELSFGNITIMKSVVFNDYCNFIFHTLEKVKEILIGEGYITSFSEKIFARKLGYLAEILTGTYLLANRKVFKIKYFPVAFLSE